MLRPARHPVTYPLRSLRSTSLRSSPLVYQTFVLSPGWQFLPRQACQEDSVYHATSRNYCLQVTLWVSAILTSRVVLAQDSPTQQTTAAQTPAVHINDQSQLKCVKLSGCLAAVRRFHVSQRRGFHPSLLPPNHHNRWVICIAAHQTKLLIHPMLECLFGSLPC